MSSPSWFKQSAPGLSAPMLNVGHVNSEVAQGRLVGSPPFGGRPDDDSTFDYDGPASLAEAVVAARGVVPSSSSADASPRPMGLGLDTAAINTELHLGPVTNIGFDSASQDVEDDSTAVERQFGEKISLAEAAREGLFRREGPSVDEPASTPKLNLMEVNAEAFGSHQQRGDDSDPEWDDLPSSSPTRVVMSPSITASPTKAGQRQKMSLAEAARAGVYNATTGIDASPAAPSISTGAGGGMGGLGGFGLQLNVGAINSSVGVDEEHAASAGTSFGFQALTIDDGVAGGGLEAAAAPSLGGGASPKMSLAEIARTGLFHQYASSSKQLDTAAAGSGEQSGGELRIPVEDINGELHATGPTDTTFGGSAAVYAAQGGGDEETRQGFDAKLSLAEAARGGLYVASGAGGGGGGSDDEAFGSRGTSGLGTPHRLEVRLNVGDVNSELMVDNVTAGFGGSSELSLARSGTDASEPRPRYDEEISLAEAARAGVFGNISPSATPATAAMPPRPPSPAASGDMRPKPPVRRAGFEGVKPPTLPSPAQKHRRNRGDPRSGRKGGAGKGLGMGQKLGLNLDTGTINSTASSTEGFSDPAQAVAQASQLVSEMQLSNASVSGSLEMGWGEQTPPTGAIGGGGEAFSRSFDHRTSGHAGTAESAAMLSKSDGLLQVGGGETGGTTSATSEWTPDTLAQKLAELDKGRSGSSRQSTASQITIDATAGTLTTDGVVIGAKGFVTGNARPTTTSTSKYMNWRDTTVQLELLGKGASGRVYKAIHVPTLTLCAAKLVPVYDRERRHLVNKELKVLYNNLAQLSSTVKGYQSLQGQEPAQLWTKPVEGQAAPTAADDENGVRSLMLSSTCAYMISFYDAFVIAQEGSLCFLLEYMDSGSLEEILEEGGLRNEMVLANVSYCVLRGLEYIHSRRQIHRDIKPANILINHFGEVKIADFGIIKELETGKEEAATFVGTMNYMSPERMRGQSYSYNSDVWSLGLTVLTVALGFFPLETKGGYWSMLDAFDSGEIPGAPRDKFSPDFCDFIDQCLEVDPEKRSSASKLLEHPFVVDCPASHRDLSAPRPAVTEDNPDALEELDQIVASVIKYRKRATIRHNKATVSRQRSEHYHQLGVQLGLRPETVERAFLTATIAVNRELRDQRQKAEAEAAAAAH